MSPCRCPPKYQADTDTRLAAARCGTPHSCASCALAGSVSWEIVNITTVTTANVPMTQHSHLYHKHTQQREHYCIPL